MPSIASHFVCAKLVSDNLNVEVEDFYKGNILPDIILLDDSHHKIRGSFYLIPNIDYFVTKLDLTKDIELGYLCHLLLDKYFIEKFIPATIPNYKEINIFSSEMIYSDYTIINYLLIEKFNLDIDFINKIMLEIPIDIDAKKYDKNLKCINQGKINEDLRCLNIDKYILFLEEISDVIVTELKKLKKVKVKK